jgi:hypothetical protein
MAKKILKRLPHGMAISLLRCRIRLSALERKLIVTPRVAEGLASAAADLRRDLKAMASLIEGNNRAAIEVMVRQAAAHERRYRNVADATKTEEMTTSSLHPASDTAGGALLSS